MPTRDRFELASRFIKSLELNSKFPKKIELLIYVDDDDKKSLELHSNIIPIKIFSGKKLTMGGYNTFLQKKSSGNIIMLVNDDIVIKTKNWDVEVRNLNYKFNDQIYLAYPNDLNKGRKLCTFPIISKKTCNKLVRPFPVEYSGAFIDLNIFDIFKRLEKFNMKRIIYLENVIFEHLHFRTGKSSLDGTYIKRNRFEDDDTFHNLFEFRTKQVDNLRSSQIKNDFNLNDISIQKNLSFLQKLITIFGYPLKKNMPIKWGIYLTTYFFARTIYNLIFVK